MNLTTITGTFAIAATTFFSPAIKLDLIVSDSRNDFEPTVRAIEYTISEKSDFGLNVIDSGIIMTTMEVDKQFNVLKKLAGYEEISIGEKPTYFDFYNSLRSNTSSTEITTNEYSMLLNKVLLSGNPTLQKAVLNVLSIFDYIDIQPIEIETVIMLLQNVNLTVQEYALNTISCWNSKEVINRVRDASISINHEYLQRRLTKIISRYEV